MQTVCVRPTVAGYIDVVDPGETVQVRKHFVGVDPRHLHQHGGNQHLGRTPRFASADRYWKRSECTSCPRSRPIWRFPSASINRKSTLANTRSSSSRSPIARPNRPSAYQFAKQTRRIPDFAFETVRSYGPNGDDRFSSASERIIPRIEPGASYSMSRTMRVRKPVAIPYFAKIAGANGLQESELPSWSATTQVTGAQVASDIAPWWCPIAPTSRTATS